MRRYSSTPNRLSNVSSKYMPPAKRYINNYLTALFIFIIVFIVILLVYKSCCNDTNYQQMENENSVKLNESNQESKKILKKVAPKKSEISIDTIPKDSLPPETNLKILTDEH